MDVKDLKILFDMITETDFTEFEMKNSDEKIVIRRGSIPGQVAMAPGALVAQTPAPASTAQMTLPQASATSPATDDLGGVSIKSPIVGTFYSSPEPGAATYVEVGQVVEKGQMLCIVEAMKLMNEIEAEFRCRILKVCKENAQAVEFGDPLFIVEMM